MIISLAAKGAPVWRVLAEADLSAEDLPAAGEVERPGPGHLAQVGRQGVQRPLGGRQHLHSKLQGSFESFSCGKGNKTKP